MNPVLPPTRVRRGLVIGELLLAFVMLAVAVSSVAALMYSASRPPSSPEAVACAWKTGPNGKCIVPISSKPVNKLLRDGCATILSASGKPCKDSVATVERADDVVIRARKDSVSMALLAKSQKPKRSERPDRGFVR